MREHARNVFNAITSVQGYVDNAKIKNRKKASIPIDELEILLTELRLRIGLIGFHDVEKYYKQEAEAEQGLSHMKDIEESDKKWN